MQFTFKARMQNGEVKRGRIEAIDRDAAAQLLQKNNLVPLEITVVKEGSSLEAWVERITSSVSQKNLLVFYRQLSALVGAKFPLRQPCAQSIVSPKMHSCVL